MRKQNHASRALIRDVDRINPVSGIARGTLENIRPEDSCQRLNEILDAQVKRIAQALHDETSQLLTSAHIALAYAGRDASADGRNHLQDVKTHLDQIEEQLRRLAHELRPRILDDLGLLPALEFLIEGVGMRRGISITIDAALDRRLPPVVETTIYHFVLEALTNTGRHARATHASVGLSIRSRSLRCTVKDDGVGFDANAVVGRTGDHGCGLIGIRERATALGGTFQITSAPASGTELEIMVPLAIRQWH
jgi:signal transduction histidine kinase